jgi:hypothetical protein
VEAVAGEDAAVAVAVEPEWIRRLPVLGVGVGFRRRLAAEIAANAASIDFLEIIADHYLDPTPYDRRELKELARRFPLVPHGLSLSVGTAEPADEQYLSRVAHLVKRINAPWWSDHLAMTRAGGIDIGHLAPLPFTEEMLEVVCANINRAREGIRAPFIIENIAYTMRLPGADMTEADFLRRVVERTDSGLLLDLMNLHANSLNHGYDAREFLAAVPLERVVQVHVIGGHYHRGVLVDSHSSRTPEEVWKLLEIVARQVDIRAVLIEWDEQLPDFAVILDEVRRAREVLRCSSSLAVETCLQ